MMSWTAENKFVAGLVLQDGFVGVTFPYYFKHNPSHQQGTRNNRRDEANETPDEDVFRYIATNIIGQNQKYSARNISCYYKAEGGVENGYRMSERYYRKETLFLFFFKLKICFPRKDYSGSLPDFSYLFTNTIELSFGTINLLG